MKGPYLAESSANLLASSALESRCRKVTVGWSASLQHQPETQAVAVGGRAAPGPGRPRTACVDLRGPAPSVEASETAH